MPIHPSSLLGHTTLVQAHIALTGMKHHYFLIDEHRALVLKEKVEQQFDGICEDLNPAAKVDRDSHIISSEPNPSKKRSQLQLCDFFNWSNGKVKLDDRGNPANCKKGSLKQWLRYRYNKLFDIHDKQPVIPLDGDGTPPLNPEEWGYWASCDRQLWQWRQLYRLAELKRLCSESSTRISPRYKTSPVRSYEPNLQVYRSFKLPVFVPRPGHIFLAGTLPHLTLRCFLAICFQRQLSASDLRYESRVLDILRSLHDGFTTNVMLSTVLYAEYQSTQAEDHNNRKNLYDEAVREFKYWIEAEDPRGLQWSSLMDLMLRTCALNLPDELLRCSFELQQAASESSHLPLFDWRKLRLVFDTRLFDGFRFPFSKDTSKETISARRKITPEQVKDLIPREHTNQPGKALHNFSSKERHPLNKLLKRTGESKPNDYLTVCSTSLAGRLTDCCKSHAQLRAKEVLMTVEDVMMRVAYQLITRGYRLLGLTDDEFVLEVRADQATDELIKHVKELVVSSVNNILQVVPGVCNLSTAEAW